MSDSDSSLSQPQAALLTLAQEVSSRCPDMRQQAWGIASSVLKAHNLGTLAPDKVYWHRFRDQVSSPRAFSGWAHYQRPLQSITLVELVMVRFSANDSEAPDALDAQTGFYREGPDAAAFDERNDIPLLPSAVMNKLWAVDFKQRFTSQCEQFWVTHAEDYRSLAKATLIAHALQARQHKTFTDVDLSRVLQAIAGTIQAPATLPMLQAAFMPPASIHVSFLRIGQHQATDILHLIRDDTHYLYVPGEPEPWQVCADWKAVHWWLLMHNNQAENRARFASHFPLRSALADEGKQPSNQTLDLLYSTWGRTQCPLLEPPAPSLRQDVFTQMSTQAQARMADDAELRLTSNATLRKQIWLGYLGAFNRVFGPLGALDWPVTLACIGAGLAEVALNVDLAVNAPSTARRQHAILNAVVASVNLLFNSAFLWGAWRGTPPVETPRLPESGTATEVALPDITPERRYPVDTATLLEQFHSNHILGAYTPGQSGLLEGIYAVDGRFYIELDGFSYQVQQAPALNGWVIVDPTSPFAFQRNVPVRLNADGQWELVPRPGLLGGGQTLSCLNLGRGLARVPDYTPPPPSPYDVPPAHQAPLRTAAGNLGSPLLDGEDYDFVGYPEGNEALTVFRERRASLQRDSQAFFQAYVPPLRSPNIEPVPPSNARAVLSEMFGDHDGVVLGEAHQDNACRVFLIDHMASLRKLGVNTLYMEHLLADFHQADLATALQQRTLPPNLKAYLNRMDIGFYNGHPSLGTYTELVQTACEQGIRVVPLDCLASYRVNGLANTVGNLRQQMMNFYAHGVIQADEIARASGKWVALVGNSHASLFRGIEGLDTLEGVNSVRFEDVPPGTGQGLQVDPGRYVEVGDGRQNVILHSDYLYRMEALRLTPPIADHEIAERLAVQRTFLLNPSDEGWKLSIRSPGNRPVTTPVLREGTLFWVNLPQLRQVHQVRYTSLTALSNELKRLGFRSAN